MPQEQIVFIILCAHLLFISKDAVLDMAGGWRRGGEDPDLKTFINTSMQGEVQEKFHVHKSLLSVSPHPYYYPAGSNVC